MTDQPKKPGFDGPNYDEYLGDGVYASWRNGAVQLRTDTHESEPVITLDPGVLACLSGWYKRVQEAAP